MARTWQQLFATGDDAPPVPEEPEEEPQRRGFFRRLRENMSKTREALGAELQATVFQSLDDEAFEHLEETLIYADVGAPTTAAIVERLER
jgi:fused signal recognition particle receptor